MYFSLVNKEYEFHSYACHAFGLLMGDFRFDNKIFSCVGTHLPHNSAFKNRHVPRMKTKNMMIALSGKYHYAILLENLNKVRKLLFYLRKKATSHKGQKTENLSWP